MKKISIEEFEQVIGEELTQFAKQKILQYSFEYEELSEEEYLEAIEKIKNSIKNPPTISGKHRAKDWENGWTENKKLFLKEKNARSLIPKYFGKFPYVRWNKNLIKTLNKDFEYNMLSLLEYQIFSKYFSNYKNIYEFGCGTGHNLLRVKEVKPDCKLYGLDWASSSQELLNILSEEGIMKCESTKFDFFQPEYSLEIKESSAIYTIAALEQIGSNYKNFVDFLLEKKPDICVNVEPIIELFNDSNIELDQLCVQYCESRNYLNGFLTYLKELESQNKIQIIENKRNYIGSFFLEGYSTIIWKIL